VAEAVKAAATALAENRQPVVLADYSDRSGNATWLLREVIEQDLGGVVVATLRDDRTLTALTEAGAKAGDAFDREVGGYIDESAGEPVRVEGVLARVNTDDDGRVRSAQVRFGRGNLLMLSPQLVQIIDPESLRAEGVEIERYQVFAIKSRVHFRRGFDDNGFAETILLVEPPGPFMGTVHLDALEYENLRVGDYYPFSEKEGKGSKDSTD